MVKSTRIVNGAKSIENRYFITSLTDVTQFAEPIDREALADELVSNIDMSSDQSAQYGN